MRKKRRRRFAQRSGYSQTYEKKGTRKSKYAIGLTKKREIKVTEGRKRGQATSLALT